MASGIGLAWQSEQRPPVFRITSTRVVAEFIAIDKQGRIVGDLKPEEVEVYADGKKQQVDSLLRPDEGLGRGYVTPGQLASAGDSASNRSSSATTFRASSGRRAGSLVRR